jgi:RNase P subunit RPR2
MEKESVSIFCRRRGCRALIEDQVEWDSTTDGENYAQVKCEECGVEYRVIWSQTDGNIEVVALD